MVSFQCDGCADTVKKPQLDKHRQRCWASFTCLDCSTTFQNQDYKSHTSCISEAEKYQGSLYRGPRKGQQQQQQGSQKATPATSFTSTPADSPAPEGAGTNGIHPSRLNQLQSGNSDARGGASPRGRGGFAQRGRGGFGARGGFGGPQGQNGGFGGGMTRKSVTGENRTAPEGGMRTWGSTPASDAGTPDVPETNSAADADGKDAKKKKRKGDKGGTGSKANSRLKNESEPQTDVPLAKKRKRDDDDKTEDATEAPASVPSDKALKRLRKHMSKLEDKSDGAVTLAEWLKRVAQGKEKTVDQSDILAGVKVTFAEGRWQLSL